MSGGLLVAGTNSDAGKSMLVAGYPVIFGFSVPTAMVEGDFDGFLRFPPVDDGYVGGHCVYSDCYSDGIMVPGEKNPGALLVVNSWGTGFGLKGENTGCFWLPYRFVEAGIASDFYAMRLVDLP